MIIELEHTCIPAVIDVLLVKSHNNLHLNLIHILSFIVSLFSPSSQGNEKAEAQ